MIKIRYKTIDSFIEYTGETFFDNNNKVGEKIAIWYKRDDPAVFRTDRNKRLLWVLVFTLLFFRLVCWLSL